MLWNELNVSNSKNSNKWNRTEQNLTDNLKKKKKEKVLHDEVYENNIKKKKKTVASSFTETVPCPKPVSEENVNE